MTWIWQSVGRKHGATWHYERNSQAIETLPPTGSNREGINRGAIPGPSTVTPWRWPSADGADSKPISRLKSELFAFCVIHGAESAPMRAAAAVPTPNTKLLASAAQRNRLRKSVRPRIRSETIPRRSQATERRPSCCWSRARS